MTIKEKCILSSPTLLTKNPQECVLNAPGSPLKFNQFEAEVNKVLKTYSSSIDFLPLVRFIDEGNAKFETLLNRAEEKQIPNAVEEALPRRKIKYHLRYHPYYSFQEESEEHKKKQVVNLVHSGVKKTAIKKEYGISNSTLKEWCALSPWSGWRTTRQKDRKVHFVK